jgi:hypothetical protein
MDLLWLVLVGLPAGDPPLAERDRFPPRHEAADALRLNRTYRQQVECWRWTYSHQRDYWEAVLHETDYLYHCWDWLHAAQGGEGRDEPYWRHSLTELRALLGESAFQAGSMPPPVPLWRFRRMN